MSKVLDDILRSAHLYDPLVDCKHTLERLMPSGRRREAALQELYSLFVSPGDLVFDIGANVGEMTQVFLSLGTSVVCVEPQPSCLRVLQRRFGSNRNVVIVGCAAGDANGQANLYLSTARPLASLSADWIDAVTRSGRFGHQTWPTTDIVQVRTLDSIIEQYGMPRFIKIDVEGYEYQVLRGLQSGVRGCSIEYTPERVDATFDCIAYLIKLGMRWFNYAYSADPRLVSPTWLSAGEIGDVIQGLSSHALSGDIYAVAVPPTRAKITQVHTTR